MKNKMICQTHFQLQVEMCQGCQYHKHQDPEDIYVTQFNLISKELSQNFTHIRIIKNVPPPHIQSTGQPRKFKDQRTNEKVIFPRLGAFQLISFGTIIFSRLATKSWPQVSQVIQSLKVLLYAKSSNRNPFLEFQLKKKNSPQKSSAAIMKLSKMEKIWNSKEFGNSRKNNIRLFINSFDNQINKALRNHSREISKRIARHSRSQIKVASQRELTYPLDLDQKSSHVILQEAYKQYTTERFLLGNNSSSKIFSNPLKGSKRKPESSTTDRPTKHRNFVKKNKEDKCKQEQEKSGLQQEKSNANSEGDKEMVDSGNKDISKERVEMECEQKGEQQKQNYSEFQEFIEGDEGEGEHQKGYKREHVKDNEIQFDKKEDDKEIHPAIEPKQTHHQHTKHTSQKLIYIEASQVQNFKLMEYQRPMTCQQEIAQELYEPNETQDLKPDSEMDQQIMNGSQSKIERHIDQKQQHCSEQDSELGLYQAQICQVQKYLQNLYSCCTKRNQIRHSSGLSNLGPLVKSQQHSLANSNSNSSQSSGTAQKDYSINQILRNVKENDVCFLAEKGIKASLNNTNTISIDSIELCLQNTQHSLPLLITFGNSTFKLKLRHYAVPKQTYKWTLNTIVKQDQVLQMSIVSVNPLSKKIMIDAKNMLNKLIRLDLGEDVVLAIEVKEEIDQEISSCDMMKSLDQIKAQKQIAKKMHASRMKIRTSRSSINQKAKKISYFSRLGSVAFSSVQVTNLIGNFQLKQLLSDRQEISIFLQVGTHGYQLISTKVEIVNSDNERQNIIWPDSLAIQLVKPMMLNFQLLEEVEGKICECSLNTDSFNKQSGVMKLAMLKDGKSIGQLQFLYYSL